MSVQAQRLEVLEWSVGGVCRKCAGVMVTFVNGELRTISRHGQPLGVEERTENESTRPRCPGVRRGVHGDKGAIGEPP